MYTYIDDKFSKNTDDKDVELFNEQKHGTTIPMITILIGDTLLVASIAISLSALILQGTDGMIAYHYNIVCNLAIAATFASLTTTLALPLFTIDRWTSIVRVFLYLFSIGLLAGLLILRSHAGGAYPGRVPSNNVQKDSAMVLQMSCFLHGHIPTDCRFSTDRRPIPALSDAWALLPLAFITFVSISIHATAPRKWSNVDQNMHPTATTPAEQENILDRNKITFYRDSITYDLIIIYVSTAWTIFALWQAFSLRKWMNASGWFEDPAELVIDSFSQLVPIFQILTLLIIVAAAFDGKCDRVLVF